VLLSGHHGDIARWRFAQSLRRTLDRRPDLIERRGGLREDERKLLRDLGLG
jgi:tRNA (guanine37-N1)-methyltransferase